MAGFTEKWGAVPAASGLDTTAMLRGCGVRGPRHPRTARGRPALGLPDRDLATRALERVEFLVAVDTTLNASSMLADVVLPAAGYAERAGTTTNIEGRVSRLAAKVVPPGVARADWVIATELAERLDADLGFESLDGIWSEIEQLAPAYSGCTLGALASSAAGDGIVVPIRASSVELRPRHSPFCLVKGHHGRQIPRAEIPFRLGLAQRGGVLPFGPGRSLAGSFQAPG